MFVITHVVLRTTAIFLAKNIGSHIGSHTPPQKKIKDRGKYQEKLIYMRIVSTSLEVKDKWSSDFTSCHPSSISFSVEHLIHCDVCVSILS